MNNAPISNLIQLHCDGELSPEQAVAFQQHLENHPADRDSIRTRVEFEQRLRSEVGDVMKMSSPACPATVAAAIRADFARASAEDFANDAVGSERMKIRRGFNFPQRANVFAVAATLALIAGAVLYGIFGRSIDESPPLRSSELVAKAGIFADQEHGVCASNSSKLKEKAPITAQAEAEELLQGWLGSSIKIFDLRSVGYEFVGAGQCEMPLPDRSGHLMYRKMTKSAEHSPMLSVFIVPSNGGCKGKMCDKQRLGEWYPVQGCKCVRKVVQSTDGKLIYFVVCCTDKDLDAVTRQITMNVRPSLR